MKFKKSHLFSLLAVASSVSSTFAANINWTNGTADGNWNTSGNWAGGVVADGSVNIANFATLDITTDSTVHLNVPHTINGLTFGDTATGTAAGWTLDNNGSGTNTLTLAGTAPTITVNALGTAKNAKISAEIAGGAGLTVAGAGQLNLAGANTFTGGLNLNGTGLATISGTNAVQTWAISSASFIAGVFLNNAGAIPSSSTINIDATGTGSFPGGLSIADNLTIGSGTPININETTTNRTAFAIGKSSTLASNITITGGGTGNLQLTVGDLSAISGNIALGSAGLQIRNFGLTTGVTGLTVSSTGTFTASGNITGASSSSIGVPSSFTGTMVLSGNNSGFAGAVNIGNGSSISFSSAGTNNNLGTGSINIGSTTTAGTLVYTGTGSTVANPMTLAATTGGATISQSGTGLLKFTSALTATGAGIKTLTLQGSTAGTGEIAGAIADNSGTNKTSVSKSGTGTWTLSGVNTYTGTTTVAQGLLVANNSAAFSTSAVTIGNNGSNPAQVNLGNGVTIANAVTFGANLGVAGSGMLQVLGTDSATVSGPITINAAPSNGGHFLATTGVLNITGAITSASANVIQRSGTVVYSGSGSSFATFTQTGTTKLGATNGLATNASVLIGNSGPGTLDLNAFNQTLAGVTKPTGNAATITNTAATPSTLTLNNSGAVTYAGTIIDGTGGVSLVQSGIGTTTLTGTNTYTGITTISAGTLALGASGALSSASSISITAGGTLDVSGLGASATYTLGTGATLTASGTGTTAGTTAAVIKGGTTGTVSLGSQPMTLGWSGGTSGTDTTHPALTVSQGTLSLSGNTITVATSQTLGAGVYTLVGAPSITGTVNSTPTFSGGGGFDSSGGKVAVISISGNTVILTVSTPGGTISATGSPLAPVSTTYGTPSGEDSFTVSGSSLSLGITVTPPVGYEVSTTSGSGYAGSGTPIVVGSAPTVSSTTVFVRLAANAPVSGSYNSQNFVLTSGAAPTVNVVTAASGNTVSAKPLTVASATAKNKLVDGTTTATITGTLGTSEAFGAGTSSDGLPYTGDTLTVSAPGTFASAAVGNGISVTPGTFTLGGSSAGNYTLTQPTGLSLTANITSTGIWSNTAGGTWTNGSNWLDTIIPTGSGITADFSTLSLSANATVTLDGARTIGALVFDDQSVTKHAWTLSTGTAGPLTLAVSSGSPLITTNVATTISAVLAGSQGLTKAGTDTLALSATNTYTGDTIINAGLLDLTGGGGSTGTIRGMVTVNPGSTLRLSAGDVTGYGGGATAVTAINLTGGTMNINTITNQTLGSAVINMTGGSITGISGSNLDFFAGASALNTLASATTSTISGTKINLRQNNGVTFNVADGAAAIDLQVDSVISMAGGFTNNGLVKAGAGLMLLTNTNTYTGVTTVNGGTLAVNGATASGSAATVGGATATGTPTLTGTGTVAGTVNIAAAGGGAAGTVNPGTIGGIGTLSTGATTISGTYVCDLDDTTSDKIASSGALTLSGATLTFNALATPAAASYTIATCTGTPAAFTTVNNLPAGYVLQYKAGSIQLVKDGFGTWAASKGLDGTLGHENGPLDDPNHNGISNVLEYVLNGEPLNAESTTDILPTLDASGSDFVFTFVRRAESDADTTQIFEYGSNLSGWTDLRISAPTNAAVFLFQPDGGTPNLQTVVVSVPKGANTVMFGRLKVSKP